MKKETVLKMSDREFDWTKIKDFTKADYDAIIAQGGKPYHIHVAIDEDESYDYLAVRPNRSVMECVGKAGRDGDFDKSNDIMIKNCIKAGNMQAVDDSVVFVSLLQSLQKISSQAQTSFTKA